MTANPVVETYRGFEIRKYNRITMRLDIRTYKAIIDAAEDNKISLRKAICLSSSPCHKCVGVDVRAYSSEGEVIIVKRGLISQHIPAVVRPYAPVPFKQVV